MYFMLQTVNYIYICRVESLNVSIECICVCESCAFVIVVRMSFSGFFGVLLTFIMS